jgi:hypothetical protein
MNPSIFVQCQDFLVCHEFIKGGRLNSSPYALLIHFHLVQIFSYEESTSLCCVRHHLGCWCDFNASNSSSNRCESVCRKDIVSTYTCIHIMRVLIKLSLNQLRESLLSRRSRGRNSQTQRSWKYCPRSQSGGSCQSIDLYLDIGHQGC